MTETINTQSDESLGKKFGEGGGDGFEVRARGDEINVGLNGVSRGGKNSFAAESLIAGKAGGFDEAQPLFDSARFNAVAIVIEDAFAPGEAKGGIVAACENGGVLDGDAALVVIAIEGPGLQLAAGEFSFVHQRMKWMFMVVALFANGVKAGDEDRFGKRRRFEGLSLAHTHTASSIPS